MTVYSQVKVYITCIASVRINDGLTHKSIQLKRLRDHISQTKKVADGGPIVTARHFTALSGKMAKDTEL